MAEKALTAAIQEAYMHGVSTRSVDDLVKVMGGTGVSKRQVSRLCAEIDDRVKAFLDRPLEGDWPCEVAVIYCVASNPLRVIVAKVRSSALSMAARRVRWKVRMTSIAGPSY